MAKEKQFAISFPEDEKKMISAAAQYESLSMGSFIRRVSVLRAREIIPKLKSMEESE